MASEKPISIAQLNFIILTVDVYRDWQLDLMKYGHRSHQMYSVSCRGFYYWFYLIIDNTTESKDYSMIQFKLQKKNLEGTEN